MTIDRTKWLRVVLILIGSVMLAGVYPLMQLWPAGWRWQPYNPAYEHMIVGVYAVLGLFLLRSAREPERHYSLIMFAAWSSIVHSGVMAAHALTHASEREHLIADVPALLIAGMLLLWLTPRAVNRAD
jgi:hypothetical protein